MTRWWTKWWIPLTQTDRQIGRQIGSLLYWWYDILCFAVGMLQPKLIGIVTYRSVSQNIACNLLRSFQSCHSKQTHLGESKSDLLTCVGWHLGGFNGRWDGMYLTGLSHKFHHFGIYEKKNSLWIKLFLAGSSDRSNYWSCLLNYAFFMPLCCLSMYVLHLSLNDKKINYIFLTISISRRKSAERH